MFKSRDWKGCTMKRKFAVALLLFSSLVASAASDRDRTFDAPYDKVWIACVQAASQKYTIIHTDKESGILSFTQGKSFTTNSNGMNVGVTVIKVNDNQTEVIINPQKKEFQISWAGGTITKTFFKLVEEKLGK